MFVKRESGLICAIVLVIIGPAPPNNFRCTPQTYDTLTFLILDTGRLRSYKFNPKARGKQVPMHLPLIAMEAAIFRNGLLGMFDITPPTEL